jgi:hypothetical protein
MSKQPQTKIIKVQEVRRSNAATPHRNRKRYHRPSAGRVLREESR